MPAIHDVDSDDGEWTIIGLLVSKRLFSKWNNESKRQNVILVMTILDETGKLIDLETWNRLKAYCVYRKFFENEFLQITGRGGFDEPDAQFSSANYKTRRWSLIEPSGGFSLRKGLSCSIDLQNTIRELEGNRADNLVGIYLGTVKGPDTRAVRGYFVKLIDEKCKLYYVLVWHAPRLDRQNKYALFNCQVGDVVLMQNVRKSAPPSDPQIPRHYTLTTLNPPVREPACVSQRTINTLKRAWESRGTIPTPPRAIEYFPPGIIAL